MLADQILSSFTHFSNTDVDVYIFDYRGYGRSEGKRRLKAMVNDYGEIIDLLDSRPYSSRLFYAMSFGGIVLLNALKERWQGASIVIDSTPSRLSDYGCPEAYDPVNNLPEEASNFLFIAGGQDHVVTPAMSRDLIETAQERGALVLRDPEMAHPFLDRSILVRDRRREVVSSFLLRGMATGEE
jgi:alpha/beta superfamily hydrolase